MKHDIASSSLSSSFQKDLNGETLIQLGGEAGRCLLLGTFLTFLARCIIVACFLFFLGFCFFVYKVNSYSWGEIKADGIVVLTGGTARLDEGTQLLARGFGKRLLVSGVYEGTNIKELGRLFPDRKNLLECCVDLGYQAVNTATNAIEAVQWAQEKKFQSLIIVTSNYHMPRSLAEIRPTRGNIVIIPYPVFSPNLDTKSWWYSLRVGKLLFMEYTKYLYVKMRTHISFSSSK